MFPWAISSSGLLETGCEIWVNGTSMCMCRMVHIRLRRDPKLVHPVSHPGSLSWDEAGNTYVSQSIYRRLGAKGSYLTLVRVEDRIL